MLNREVQSRKKISHISNLFYVKLVKTILLHVPSGAGHVDKII